MLGSCGASWSARLIAATWSRYPSGVGAVQLTSEYPAEARSVPARSPAARSAEMEAVSIARWISVCPPGAPAARAKASPGEPAEGVPVQQPPPVRLRPARGVPQQRGAESAPLPSGHTSMSAKPRCLLSRDGSSSWYHPRSRRRPPAARSPAGRRPSRSSAARRTPGATSAARPGRRPPWSRGRSRSRRPPAVRPPPRTAQYPCSPANLTPRAPATEYPPAASSRLLQTHQSQQSLKLRLPPGGPGLGGKMRYRIGIGNGGARAGGDMMGFSCTGKRRGCTPAGGVACGSAPGRAEGDPPC